ncbi:alpha/beta-hydrolase [Lindgomyces ingoldianus]|uniref:Alpha/beta-hydrolase n=1 Tax=Lindgomyces ingoldianus TaxID=673940 RepID=A0ACB6R7S3_9PLEO|nr:alpha/beta-hydrolase [Lindgomyces ingoldianus]KAF2475231.1 alpha/beta-hydrolase [Lindgomyces ingoldianus]
MRLNGLTKVRARLSTLTTQRESNTLTLPDGRIIGYAEFGHPEGFPLLFFHGFPASRLEATGADKIARRHRVRVIALDRPGFGLSTFQPGRRITDWPADVLAFAGHAKLNRFAILGGSGGGPYALACAHLLPKEMMSAVGVMAGAPPWEAGAKHMTLPRRVTSLMAIHTPTAFGYLMDALVGLMRWAVTSGPVTRRIDKWLELENREEKSRTILEQRERILRIAFDGFAQGSQAFVQEAQLLSAQSWGFRFEDVSYNPIHIWHGTKDTSAPFVMIQYMSKRLPHSVLHECEGDTHFTMVKHLEQILRELVGHSSETESRKTD